MRWNMKRDVPRLRLAPAGPVLALGAGEAAPCATHNPPISISKTAAKDTGGRVKFECHARLNAGITNYA